MVGPAMASNRHSGPTSVIYAHKEVGMVEDLAEKDTYEVISHALMLAQAENGELSLRNKFLNERLQSVNKTYEKLYKKWWLRLLFMPFDPLMASDGKMLMRCQTCKVLFWEDGPMEFKDHLGHKYGAATNGSWWENVSLKMGRIK
jgi:hypothetical protein|tara:strand:- start:269 stop:703 length:435 start_codon:yes stop_codon:yes gene_type:complete